MTVQNKYDIPLSREISIGNLKMGGNHPVVLQSMTNTDTNDIDASVHQCLKIMEAGGEMIRLTTQGKKEVLSIEKIISELCPESKCIPIIADVHFNAAVAEKAAEVCQKVRINPGNYTERGNSKNELSEEEYVSAEKLNKQALISLLEKCKIHGTAVRIGVNHGSLSKRIMSRYGDSPVGMVESALEFLRICKEQDFGNVVISLKSSNTRVMVHSVRLLVREMIQENLYYPIHLGVTEAGDGLEGRIKSVVGVAPLLLEGIGDTLRVSLTEPPEDEIPVARSIRDLFPKPERLPYDPFTGLAWDPFRYNKPETKKVTGIGGSAVPVVWGSSSPDKQLSKQNYIESDITSKPDSFNDIPDFVLVLHIKDAPIVSVKAWLSDYYSSGCTNPVVLHKKYVEKDPERFALYAGGEIGSLLIDGLIDGVWVENPHQEPAYVNDVVFSILQASRARISATEFIACPSCGRTLFDIQSVLADVRAVTSHLVGLKIAVMGCIVNGPGEMADADYGYVGVGKGKVSLYKSGKVEMKNIPATSAVEELVALIKKHGDWVDD
ncbi:(E)-4-hydroxy-3-methylbut-2-enyl-diphosphate synthase [Bacteroidota bacterium]